MKLVVIIFFLLGIVVSGCVANPARQVPVVHVNISFVEKQSIVEVENYRLTQGKVNYLSRPRTTQAESFPAIAARTMIVDGLNSTIGPWEMLSYNGSGTYTFNIGFLEDQYPLRNETVHVSIMVVDKKGERIGYFVQNIMWD